MDNPVVVFVDPIRLEVEPEEFPIGLTSEGQRHGPSETNESYCVLLLDDNADLPGEPPCITNLSLPLLIVKHVRSKVHPSPEKNKTLSTWGKPSVCADFSHIDNDKGVFEDIKSLLQDASKAQAFAKRCRETDHLAALDTLAAICALHIFDPDYTSNETLKEKLRNLLTELEARLDMAFTNEFANARMNNDWVCGLTLVHEKAKNLI